MASQEDYLDQLLKDLTEDTEQLQVEEDITAEAAVTTEASNEEMFASGEMVASEEMFSTEDTPAEPVLDMSDMDELLKFAMEEEESEPEGMSEEEIEQILNANQNSVADSGSGVGSGEELSEADDLMSLLEGDSEDNGALQDIHDMLQKADNNEAVDEESIAAMQEALDEGSDNAEELEQLSGDSGESEETELTERQKKALEKKRLKEEKAIARKAAKEAKKAEKLAKKEAKKGKTPESEAEESDGGIDMYEALPADDAFMDAELSETDALDADLFADLEMLSSGDENNDGTDSASEDSRENEAEYIEDTEDTVDIEDTVDKNNVDAGTSKEKPKRNLLSMILNFLTEEDEDDEEAERGTEDIPLSDENRQVLEEMDQEAPDKKGKKNNKKDKKKGKKSDVETADDEDEESEDKKKATKGKKAKKPKKEKPLREKAPVNPRDKVTFKKLLPIILLGMSLLLIIMLFVNLGSDFIGKNQARKAYYEEDYETCYQELYGRKLNETEQIMFGKSESILRIRLWMREYELFVDEGSEMEALDVLIQAVNDYADLYDYANRWNAGGEVADIYGQMLVILRDKYGLTEALALEIAAEPDDVEYTRLVAAVVQGDGYTSQADEAAPGAVELPDMLPEEEHFPENNGGR